MTIVNSHCRRRARMRLAMLTLISCTIAACAGHAPTRPAVAQRATSAPAVRKHGSWSTETSAAEAKRDLAMSERDSLSASEAGYYLDVLQGRLVQVLGADTKLSRTADRIGIDLAHRLKFDTRSPWLDAAGCRVLEPLARALVEFRKTVIAVKVGVDGAGREAETLAERRAGAVAECLASAGVISKRIVIVVTRSASAASAANAAADALELDAELILRDAKNDR